MGKSGKSMKPVKGGTPKGKFKAQKKKVAVGVKGLKDMNNKKDEGSAQRMIGQRERLNLVRLERLVAKEEEALTNWAAPPPPPPPRASRIDEDGFEHFKRKPRSGPEDWKLRGAARPWESLHDGTYDPNGREYDKVVEGDDLFKTALGSFWGANEDARLHVSHCVELMEALLHASGSTDSVRASALAHGCRALELDRSDGGGGASAGGAGSSYGVSSSTAPTAEPDSKKNSSDSGFGDDYRAPCHSVALLGILLGLPEALGLGSNGVERSPAKKAKLGGSLAKGESSKALSAAAAGGSKASSNSHGGALAALEAIPRSLQRRCLKALRGASSQSTDAAFAAVLLSLLKPELAKDIRTRDKKTSESQFGVEASANLTDQASPTEPEDDVVAVAVRRNPFALFALAHPDIFAAAVAAAETLPPPQNPSAETGGEPPSVASADAADASVASDGTVAADAAVVHSEPATEIEHVTNASSTSTSEADTISSSATTADNSSSLPRSEWLMALEALRAARLAQPLWQWASRPAQEALQAATAAATAVAASAATSASASDDENFIASPKFTGFRAGFAYRAGPKGLGYYKDTKVPLKAPFVPPSAASAAKLEKAQSSQGGSTSTTTAVAAAPIAPSPMVLLRNALTTHAAAQEAAKAVSANPTLGCADVEWPAASRFAAAWAKVRPGV